MAGLGPAAPSHGLSVHGSACFHHCCHGNEHTHMNSYCLPFVSPDFSSIPVSYRVSALTAWTVYEPGNCISAAQRRCRVKYASCRYGLWMKRGLVHNLTCASVSQKEKMRNGADYSAGLNMTTHRRSQATSTRAHNVSRN